MSNSIICRVLIAGIISAIIPTKIRAMAVELMGLYVVAQL